jgi:RimJ/RimL family protein N-acetyltransferase
LNGPRLEGERVVLRPIEEADNPRLMEWRNSPAVHDNLFSEEKVLPQRQKVWYETYLLDATQLRYIIDSAAFGPVGCCGLTDVDEAAASAKMTVFLGVAEARGRGLAAEALRLLFAHAFGSMGLRKIIAEVFSDNAAATALYRRLAFREFGVGAPRRGREVTVMELAAPGGAGA